MTNPANYTPNLVAIPGDRKPVAYIRAEAGSEMVVGGDFDRVENNTRTTQYDRSNVFAFDATTGAIDQNFNPQVDNDVRSLLVGGDSVYIGGGFKNVNGQPRAALAKSACRPASRHQLPADVQGRPDQRHGHAPRPAHRRGHDQAAAEVAEPQPASRRPTCRTSSPAGLPNSNAAQVFKFDISPDGQRLVAVGNFLQVDGADRPRMFMLNLGDTSATLSSWNYPPNGVSCTSGRVNAQAYIQDVDFAPDSTWFAVASFGFQFQSQLLRPSAVRLGEPLRDQQPRPAAPDLDQLHRR